MKVVYIFPVYLQQTLRLWLYKVFIVAYDSLSLLSSFKPSKVLKVLLLSHKVM